MENVEINITPMPLKYDVKRFLILLEKKKAEGT